MATAKPDPVYVIPPDEWAAHLDGDGRWDPRCTTITKRGTQCQFRIFGGQVYSFHDGEYYISQADADTFHTGTCPYHLKLAGK